MHLYILFIISLIILIFAVSGCICYRIIFKKENRKFSLYYLIPLSCLLISIGIGIPMSISISEMGELKEWMFPEEIELPHWKTIEDIEFSQWNSIDYLEEAESTSIDFLYDGIDESYGRKAVIEILLSENHKDITDINFSILASRSKKYEERPLERALYEAEYTKDRFYLKRKKYIKIEPYTIESVSFLNFLSLSRLIREGDIVHAVSDKTNRIHICYQEASPLMRFSGQWITAINQNGEEKEAVLPSILFEIIPTTYLQVAVYNDIENSLIYFKNPPYLTFDEFMNFAEYIANAHPS